MSDELKPCPFCGGEAEVTNVLNAGKVLVGCNNDDCTANPAIVGTALEPVIVRWNRRAEVPAGWRPIPKEVDTSNPPFDGSEVLIWGEGQDGAYLAIYEADTNEPWKIADTHPSGWTPLVDAPTHWMPLPESPKDGLK